MSQNHSRRGSFIETMQNGANISLTDCQSDVTAQREAATRRSFEQAFAAHHRLVYCYTKASRE